MPTGLFCCAPARLAALPEARALPGGIHAFSSLKEFLAREYARRPAHIFVGATGIAVRALAPLLRHKSRDAPVVVIDAAGRYVISLLSGHWGGGNALARHLAALLGAQAIITTASDTRDTALAVPPALDTAVRDAGLRILDWQELPQIQAALLEGGTVRCWDPCSALPPDLRTTLQDLCPATDAKPEDATPAEAYAADVTAGLPVAVALSAADVPAVAAHWRRIKPAPGLLRLAVPLLYVGLGCRRAVPARAVREALEQLFARFALEGAAVAGLATVEEKLAEPALCSLAARLHLPLHGFAAQELCRCLTPTPSAAAGQRFDCPPFSVCEAAALTAARAAGGPRACLLIPKHRFQGSITLAVALADQTKLLS